MNEKDPTKESFSIALHAIRQMRERAVENKPWGFTVKCFHSRRVWLKFIFVRPGKQNSLHRHEYRSEFVWKLPLSFFIVPRNQLHRLLSGLYFELGIGKPDENDVIRVQDDFGRVENTTP